MAGNMDKYTVNPVSGSTLSRDEFNISFPDADGVRESYFSVYVYLNEDTQHSIWETSVSLEPRKDGQTTLLPVYMVGVL